MITEVYINGNLIDIDDEETVAASYGNITFGEFSKRKGVKTNTWSAPFSPRNKAVYESCEVVGSFSIMPYRKATIEVYVFGVLVFQGFSVLMESRENYRIQSFAGASDFYSTINLKKLSQLNLSEFAHYQSEVTQRASWANTKGYIYAYAHDGRAILGFQIPRDFFLPHIFFHTLIKQIATDAGYELQGDVLEDPRFLKHIVLCNKLPAPGVEIILSAMLPDMTQSKLWLDFANIYGQQFDIDDGQKVIRANYIDDLLTNEEEDWTDKVDKTEKPTTSYSLGYGQSTFLRYTTDDICTQDYAKEILIDDTTLDIEQDIYKSPFFLMQFIAPGLFTDGLSSSMTYNRKSGTNFLGPWDSSTIYSVGEGTDKSVVWHNGTFYVAVSSSTNQSPPNATYWKPILEKDVWDIKFRPMYGRLVTDPASPIEIIFPGGNEPVTKIINNTLLGWEETYSRHYKIFSRIIDRTKKVENLMRLNYSDINQLDFTKLKRIDNELYLVEEVKQYKLNKKDSTLVDLIRI